MTEAPLPTGYYLINFETVLREVRVRYGDLLHEEEVRTVEAFLALPMEPRRLYVRMLARKGPWFREDSLNYEEVGNVREALGPLQEAGFCAVDPTLPEVLTLLVREELAEALRRSGVPFGRSWKREALGRLLLEATDPARLLEDLCTRFRPVKPLHYELWAVICFLFFGNGEQDLSSFVLADIGMIRYETYDIDASHRLFQARRDLDFLLSLQALRVTFEASGEPRQLTEAILAMEPHPGVRQQRRYHRLLNDLGRAWERLGDRPQALACYTRSLLPPARERIVRLMPDPAEACSMAIRIAQAPLDVGEERFTRVFLRRHRARVPEASRWLEAHPDPAPLPERRLVLPRQGPVEEAVLEAAGAEGWAGFFTENTLWNALFGLVFWDILFAPLPGAFQHPFQSAPLDLGQPDFFLKREAAIEVRLEEIQDREKLIHRVVETADRKWGIANAFLSWRNLSRELLHEAVEHVPPAVLVPVLHTMARNPRAFSSGFPDLFLYRRQDPAWALWEVKGPGDALRPEQDRWLRQFQSLGCDVRVAWVTWR